MEGYGRTWETWDVPGFLNLFSDDVVYVAHPTRETVVGRAALERYVRKEAAEQGDVQVTMGSPLVEGDRVVAEFWVTARTAAGESGTIMGCLIAHLEADGRASRFREYWFDVEGHHGPFAGWGS